MKVLACCRYPVKSLLGEELPAVELEARGVVRDRWWALRTPEGRFGSGKTTRRFVRMPRLFEMSSRLVDDEAVLRLPDGQEYAVSDDEVHDAVSAVVGTPVIVAPEGAVRHHDEHPLHLVTTASLRWLGIEAARHLARANLVIDLPGTGRVEDDWVGRRLTVGDAVLEVVGGATRCVMLGHLKTLAPYALQFGVYATVVRPAEITVGSDVAFASPVS